jgi:RNA polymerase sigma-70 factor (ECF subfamily)
VADEPLAGRAPRDAQAVDEPTGFEAFFREEHARLFGTLCLVTGDAREAEDLMQEAFVRIWERWEQVRTHPDPAGYLYRTAFNAHRERLRQVRRAGRRILRAAPADDPFSSIDEVADVMTALRLLAPRQRAAIVLTDLLDMSSAEAAEFMRVKPVTVRALASAARATLRRTMGGPGV